MEVFLPKTFDELWEILSKEPEAAMYAGGTDLLVKIRSAAITPSSLVCLERIAELKGVRDHGQEVFIAAATPHSEVVEDKLIRSEFPVLASAVSVLGSPPVRHMGTIGGNIVTASPAGDTLPALHILQAEVELASASDRRRVRIGDFITGPGSVALCRGEILTGVWLQKSPSWSVHHYEKVGRRKAQACAVASLAAVLQVSESNRIDRVRLAWGSVGPTVVTSDRVEAELTGETLSLDTLRNAAHLVESVVSPIDDVRASAEYRRVVAGRLLLRLSFYARRE